MEKEKMENERAVQELSKQNKQKHFSVLLKDEKGILKEFQKDTVQLCREYFVHSKLSIAHFHGCLEGLVERYVDIQEYDKSGKNKTKSAYKNEKER